MLCYFEINMNIMLLIRDCYLVGTKKERSRNKTLYTRNLKMFRNIEIENDDNDGLIKDDWCNADYSCTSFLIFL